VQWGVGPLKDSHGFLGRPLGLLSATQLMSRDGRMIFPIVNVLSLEMKIYCKRPSQCHGDSEAVTFSLPIVGGHLYNL